MKAYLLDEKTIGMFQALYPGEIAEVTAPGRLAVGMMEEQGPAALLVATIQGTALWIDYLYVKPELRRQGVGGELLFSFLGKVKALEEITDVYAVCDEEMQLFFEEFGFEPDYKHPATSYQGVLKDMTGLEAPAKKESVKKLADLSGVQINQLSDGILKSEDAYIGIPLPINPADYMEDSLCYGDKELKAVLLLKEHNGVVEVAYAYASDHNGPMLMALLAEARASLLARLPEDTRIVVTALDDKVASIADKILVEPKRYRTYQSHYMMAKYF